MAVTTLNENIDPASATEEVKELSPKQQQRLKEQKEREAKKMEKRQAKWDQKERKTNERERREESQERKKEEVRLERAVLTPLEIEEANRLEEEKVLIEKEFEAIAKKLANDHTKKSSLESNRLGGNHMS